MKTVKQAAILCITAVLTLTAVATSSLASDLYLLGGAAQSADPTDTTYSWQLEYRHDLLKHMAAGISYLNEGHITDHHRDGYTAQVWGRTDLLDSRLTLAVGAGPYFYLDTASNNTPAGFSNEHGLKAMFSAAATWHTEKDLLFEVRSNWVKGAGGFDSASLLAGIGYHFEPELQPVDPSVKSRDPKNEVTAFLGQTIVNSFNSQRSFAAGGEYRRHLSPHVDWTLGFLYEGDNRLVRRDGLITQFWATQSLLEGLLTVGAGAGAYFDLGHYNNPFKYSSSDRFVSGIITLTGSYRLTQHWALRASWNRLVTSYDRDTDVILGGLGYRF